MPGSPVPSDLPAWPARPADANKGTFGRVLVLGGSRDMPGAAALAGLAALRGGAGIVRVAVPRDAQPIVAAFSPCLMTAGLPTDAGGRFSELAEPEWNALAEAADVVVLGPGLGRSDAISAMVPRFLATCPKAVVLDADGLNACGLSTSFGAGPRVLTPHPGEFARLLGTTTAAVQAERGPLAERFAQRHRMTLLLKGQGTIVTDGNASSTNATGNPGLAIPGSGDVLAGLIAALVAQKFALFAAARLGAHLHGLAGDRVRDAHGEVGILATDLIDALPFVIRAYRAS